LKFRAAFKEHQTLGIVITAACWRQENPTSSDWVLDCATAVFLDETSDAKGEAGTVDDDFKKAESCYHQ
jgi:hypothetical protein